MLFCLAFCELFLASLLEFKSAIEQQWDLKELRALIFSFRSYFSCRGLFKKLIFNSRQCNERRQTSWKWTENFLVLWILNWQFGSNCISLCIIMENSLFSTTCGSNGIFSRRLDFSLYNVLPKQRINSIEVKVIMEISFIFFAKVKNYKLLQLCRKKFKKLSRRSFFSFHEITLRPRVT